MENHPTTLDPYIAAFDSELLNERIEMDLQAEFDTVHPAVQPQPGRVELPKLREDSAGASQHFSQLQLVLTRIRDNVFRNAPSPSTDNLADLGLDFKRVLFEQEVSLQTYLI